MLPSTIKQTVHKEMEGRMSPPIQVGLAMKLQQGKGRSCKALQVHSYGCLKLMWDFTRHRTPCDALSAQGSVYGRKNRHAERCQLPQLALQSLLLSQQQSQPPAKVPSMLLWPALTSLSKLLTCHHHLPARVQRCVGLPAPPVSCPHTFPWH